MAYAFNPFTGTFDYYESAGVAPKSFVAPYLVRDDDPVLTVEDRNVMHLAANLFLDGEIKLDGMMVTD